MPRPSSKIMQINPTDVSDATPKAPRPKATAPGKEALLQPAASNVVSLAAATDAPAAKPARKGKAPAVVLSKAEVKQKIADLKAAHKLGRGPLNEAEDALVALNKADVKAGKEAEKAIAAIQAAEAKRQKQVGKDHAAITAKIMKYSEQYAKAQAKFDAELAKLQPAA